MATEEEKIISDVSKENDSIKDYISFSRINSNYRLERRRKKLMFLTITLLIYAIAAVIALIKFKENSSLLHWPTNDQKIKDLQIKVLQEKITSIENDVKNIQTSLSSSSKDMFLNNYINIKLDELTKRERALEEAIYLDPEKALTTTLLKEKQKDIEDDFSQLRETQSKLDTKLDNFITTVIITPIIVAVLAILGWLIRINFFKKIT